MSLSELLYTDSLEELLKEEAQKCESMSILHHLAYRKFNKLSMGTNIPVIIISSVTGFLLPISIFEQQDIFLGLLSLLCGIIKTLDSYFDFTKRTQTHYLTALAYKKISKFLMIQLGLDRMHRIKAEDLLNIILNDVESIINSEPDIPNDIILEFNKKYNIESSIKPSICCDKLTEIKIQRGITIDIEIQTDFHQRAVSPDKKKPCVLDFVQRAPFK